MSTSRIEIEGRPFPEIVGIVVHGINGFIRDPGDSLCCC